MAYIGQSPAPQALVASDITDGIISNAKLAQDIISADTALGAEPADTDEFLVSDAGTLKRMDYSYIKGGGKVLQVVSGTDGTTRTTTDTSWVTASNTCTCAITPSATSSKILLMFNSDVYGPTADQAITINRDSTNLGDATNGFIYGADSWITGVICYLDSPATTSEIVYTFQCCRINPGTGYVNNIGEHHHMQCIEIDVS